MDLFGILYGRFFFCIFVRTSIGYQTLLYLLEGFRTSGTFWHLLALRFWVFKVFFFFLGFWTAIPSSRKIFCLYFRTFIGYVSKPVGIFLERFRPSLLFGHVAHLEGLLSTVEFSYDCSAIGGLLFAPCCEAFNNVKWLPGHKVLADGRRKKGFRRSTKVGFCELLVIFFFCWPC